MNLNFNFTGKTTLKDWWKIVRDNFTTVKETVESHIDAAVLPHADKSVKQRHIDDKAVGTNQIADYGVSTMQIAQYAITGTKIYPGAVQTPHIKDANVTKAKLEQDIQDQLDEFQEHLDNPAGEVGDGQITTNKLARGAVTEDKIDETTSAFLWNYYLDSRTGDECANDFDRASGRSHCYSFNSKYGKFVSAPEDMTPYTDGNVRYVVFVVPLNMSLRIQFAFNIASGRKFFRVIEAWYVPWIEIT